VSEIELENKITHLLSEWLNDMAPLGQERYRAPAKAVIAEVKKSLVAKSKKIKL
jgi:hypothetical protein